MKSPATIALACATPLVIAASFALPDLVCSLQDNAKSAAVTHYDSKLVQLDIEPSDDIVHTLETFASDATLYGMDVSERTNPHDVRAAMSDLLPFETASSPLARAFVLCDPSSCTVTDTPLLAVSADGGQAAMLWNCTLENSARDVFASLFIDDASGKILEVTLILDGEPAAYEIEGAAFDDLDAALLAWAAHLGVDVGAFEHAYEHREDEAVSDIAVEEDGVSSAAAVVPESYLTAKASVRGTNCALEAMLQTTEVDQIVLTLKVANDTQAHNLGR